MNSLLWRISGCIVYYIKEKGINVQCSEGYLKEISNHVFTKKVLVFRHVIWIFLFHPLFLYWS